jgi:Holliday junction resolvase RusA-like endonuclease
MWVQVAEFFVPGVPVPQGSKKGFVRGGRAQLVDDNAATLGPWRATVTALARANYSGPMIDAAVLLICEFRFVRPKSVSAKARPFPTVKPDSDKLERALCDGITDSGLWRDDALVVEVSKKKVYAERPGVQVRIGQWREETK